MKLILQTGRDAITHVANAATEITERLAGSKCAYERETGKSKRTVVVKSTNKQGKGRLDCM